MPGVVQIVPNDRKEHLLAETDIGARHGASGFGDGDGACGAEIAPGLAGRTAFTLRVQTGCDQTCSYCIIPSTRGTGRSRPLREVLSEIERVARCRLSRDRDHGRASRLVRPRSRRRFDAARACCRRSSVERPACASASARSSRWIVRTRSSIWSPDRTCFAPHFHLPLQHASDRMLVAMRRPYTLGVLPPARRSHSATRCRTPRSAPTSSSDFPARPTMTSQCWRRTCATSPLTHVHVFPYSDRPGTAATALPGKVHGSIVRERAAIVRGDRPRAEPSDSIARRTARSDPG